MTEVAIQNQPGTVANLAPEPIQTETVKDLVAWASEMHAANTIAKAVCSTMFVPQHFRDKPDEATAAILFGYTVGLAPMVALKSIYVVHGAPGMYAQTMFAIALAKGHQIERVYADDVRVEFRCKRRGSTQWQRVEWTIERARKAKYTSNAKYNENPIGMLTEKCKAEAAKLVAPDSLAGLYSVEEIELGDYEDSAPTPTPVIDGDTLAPIADKPKRTIKRRAAAPAPEVPDVVADPPAPEEEPEPAGEPVDTETGELPPERDWFAEIDLAAGDVTALRTLWTAARDAGTDPDTLDAIASAATAAKEA